MRRSSVTRRRSSRLPFYLPDKCYGDVTPTIARARRSPATAYNPLVILRTLKVLGILSVVAICTSQASDSWVLRRDGIGPVKVGMNLAQLNTVLHEKFAVPESKDEQACFYVDTAQRPHVSFMMVKGRLARIDVDGAGVPTADGIQVGDSEEHARHVYGSRLTVKPHAYTGPEGHYLTIRSVDGRYGIRFETDNGKITMFYAGRFDAIQYIEGCE